MAGKADKFFTWVWRLNGVLVLVVATVSVVGLVAMIIESGLFGSNDDRPRAQLADVAGEDIASDDFSLGHFRRLAGTDFLYATMGASGKYRGSGSKRGNVRNWLFFDIESRNAHWLFADSTKEIIDYQFLYRYPTDDLDRKNGVVIGIVMLIRDADTASESARKIQMVLVSTDGKTITGLADSVGGLFDYFYMSEISHLLFYSREGAVRIMDLDPISGRVLSDSVLSTDE